ncbi:MAG: hypothetical protein GY713_00640 [Actinomycetia bacterium]|nr:hypothetical protein [Actinomycetes bacterium]
MIVSETVDDTAQSLGFPARVGLVILGFTSVASLLGWVYGVARFDVLFRLVTVPGALVLLGLGLGPVRTRPALRRVIVVGTIAGLVGTIGYDVFRIPFIYGGGMLLLSPIESYGVLADGGAGSSGWTDFLGWSYHLSNGIGFAIAYVAMAERRHWGWGVLYAAALETGTILTPFADSYSLTGKWGVIAVAYAAHVPYGLALGWFGRYPDRTLRGLAEIGRWSVPALVAGSFVGLALWLEPGSGGGETELVVRDGRLVPEWTVTALGECVEIRNLDAEPYGLAAAINSPTLPANGSAEMCFADPGVHRVRTTGEVFAGGFVIVDPER